MKTYRREGGMGKMRYREIKRYAVYEQAKRHTLLLNAINVFAVTHDNGKNVYRVLVIFNKN